MKAVEDFFVLYAITHQSWFIRQTARYNVTSFSILNNISSPEGSTCSATFFFLGGPNFVPLVDDIIKK